MQYLRFASKSKISISSKSKSSAESYEQNIFTSSRKTVKKLTESDLNTNSPSLKDQKTTAGSSASGPDSI